MDVFSSIIVDFANKFLGQAPLLLGTVVLIGYLLLKKKWYEALAGFIKTYVGFRILQVGSGGLVTTFRPIIDAIYGRFNITAYVGDPYFGFTSALNILESIDSLQFVAYVMLIAFLTNIVLVVFHKQTKLRSLYLTGHAMYMGSAVLLWILYWALNDANGEPVSLFLVILSGVLLGTYWSVASNLMVEATNDLTNGEGFSLGHNQMFGAWAAYRLGKYVGKKEDNVSELNLPGFLKIFNDNIVANVVIMTLFVGTLMLILGQEAFDYNTNNYYFGTYILETTSLFAVYITVILTGVRMFVSELNQSFQGISDRLLPGSVPALDAAVTFRYSPNAPAWGFMFGFLGQVLAISILLLFNSPILLIAGFIVLFFDNGTIAVYANQTGGRKAAALFPFMSGMLQILGSALILTILQSGGNLVIGYFANFDWSVFFTGVTILTRWMGIVAPILVIGLLLIIPQLQYKRNKANYFTTMRDDSIE